MSDWRWAVLVGLWAGGLTFFGVYVGFPEIEWPWERDR